MSNTVQEARVESSVPETAEPQPAVPQIPRRKRRFGDRYDGYRVRELDLPFRIIPNIMPTRTGSQIFFEEVINISELERYVRRKRATDLPNLRLLHVVLAALVRILVMRPQLNRFIAGKKIYAHNNIRLSMSVKRSMTDDGEETEILPVFQPTDTLKDVMARFEEALQDTLSEETDETHTDSVNRALGFIPTWLKSFVVGSMRNLDKIGLMPKVIYRASPFHSSAYVTDVGSLGIDSIYHHLYDFGTTSIFLAMGKKRTEPYVKPDGSVGERRVICFRFVLDERICDGHYYASSIKQFRKLLRHPEVLELPPETIPDEI